MLEKIYTKEFDDKIILSDGIKNYTYKDLKLFISSAAAAVKPENQNIVIVENNNFNFIIKFFAAVFTGKNIYLLPDVKKLKELDFKYSIFQGSDFKPAPECFNFPEIDINKPVINFFTSGSSSKSKMIKKSLYNLIKEGEDAAAELFKLEMPEKIEDFEESPPPLEGGENADGRREVSPVSESRNDDSVSGGMAGLSAKHFQDKGRVEGLKSGRKLIKPLKLRLNEDTLVISSAPLCHLFGMTFHLMMPLAHNLKIYTPAVLYPDKINFKNAVFVSTPSFLSTIEKYGIIFETAPEYIITAGSKLDENVFKHLKKQTNVIEIYGSTETGVIAHKEAPENPFRLFENINAASFEDYTLVSSPYIFEKSFKINDKTEINGRNIIIKSRTDRVLKIYDKRINAEELENCLKENSFVSGCYMLENEGKIACLCALSNAGREFLIKNGIFELTNRFKSFLKNHFEIIPQKWRYIDELPVTKNGKINKNVIEHIFDVNLSLPVILNRKYAPETAEYEIFFYSACSFFNGHFPDFKILPGVVQIYLAKEFANTHFNLDLGEGQLRRIKFSNIILPDTIVKLKLEKKEKQLEYTFFDDEKIYSSGIFPIENVFKEYKCS